MSTPASTGGSATSVAPTTASTRGGTVFRGVTVASSQAATPPHDYWWVIDLANGATIDGSSRVLVEIPMDEVGCGPSMRHIDAFALEYGASVTFELVAGAPGDRPTYWFAEAQSFDSEPAVRGARLTVECPPGTEEVAAELAAQRATWAQAGPPSYEFTMEIEVFGPWYGDYRVAVTNGEPVSIVREDESSAPLTPDLPATIDAVFDVLEGMVTADSFEATYDPAAGYPVTVTIDNILNAVDDEFAVRVTSLTPTEA
jgi:hypothetical protein